MSNEYMKSDPLIESQQDVCISIVNGETFDKIVPEYLYALKIRGAYADTKQAEDAADSLRKKDKDHDIMIGTMGKWLSMNPEGYYNENRYEQSELNEIMNPMKGGESKTESGDDGSGMCIYC